MERVEAGEEMFARGREGRGIMRHGRRLTGGHRGALADAAFVWPR